MGDQSVPWFGKEKTPLLLAEKCLELPCQVTLILALFVATSASKSDVTSATEVTPSIPPKKKLLFGFRRASLNGKAVPSLGSTNRQSILVITISTIRSID